MNHHKIALIGAGISLVMQKAIEERLKEDNIDCVFVGSEEEVHDKTRQKILLVDGDYEVNRDLNTLLDFSYEPHNTSPYYEDKKPRRRGQRNAHGWYNWK